MINDLFTDNKLLCMFKRPTNMYDFKKKVLAVMKVRHDRAAGHVTHAGFNDAQDEDFAAVDSLAEKLYNKMMDVVDRNEAFHH